MYHTLFAMKNIFSKFRSIKSYLHSLYAKTPQKQLLGIWQASTEYDFDKHKWECTHEYSPNEYVLLFDKRKISSYYYKGNASEKDIMYYTFDTENKKINTIKMSWDVIKLNRHELSIIETTVGVNSIKYTRIDFRKVSFKAYRNLF